MWSPPVHLRDSPRVCFHLTDRECRVLWDSLRAMANVEDVASITRDGIHQAPLKAKNMLDSVRPIESKWITLSNEQIWLCWHSLSRDEIYNSELTDRITNAVRRIERVDRAANSIGYRGPEWESQRERVQNRADGSCEFCNKSDGTLDTHHRIPVRRFNTFEEAHNTKNLVAVCPSCHGRTESAGYIKTRLVELE